MMMNSQISRGDILIIFDGYFWKSNN